jgi:hypothetical protein
MSQWQQLLHEGNDCFHTKKWKQAEYCYKEAAFHLDSLWSANTKDVELLMAWICAIHNLSSLFEVQDNADLSLQYLKIPHQRMLSIYQCNEYCEDTKLIAQHALKITFMPILMFSKRHPICDTCIQSLAEFKSTIELSQQIIH